MKTTGKEKREKGKGSKLPRAVTGFPFFHFPFSLFRILAAFVFAGLWLTPAALAQEGEVVANFSAGRVIIAVAKDGIIIVTIENKIEPEARGPIVVPLSAKRIAVLLGATEWLSPDAAALPVRLDGELPKVMGAVAGGKRLQQEQVNDLEALGIGFLEPLRKAAARLHSRVRLAADEPLVELLLIGYEENYGPEVWSLRYRMVQDPLRGDYWQTRVLRPSYNQHYPPEKGHARTLVEASYPPVAGESTLLEALLAGGVAMPALQNPAAPPGRAWLKLQAGESHKAGVDDLLALVRGSIAATVPEGKAVAIGVIRDQVRAGGFEWIVPPAETPAQRAEEQKGEPGAPSLRRKPPPPN
jgi:hypothetical protein